jgi:mannosyltransferase OCH1-like enzyme
MDFSLNPGLRADALRLEILKNCGGIYVDTDMALVKPIHELFDRFDTDFFTCVSKTAVFEVNNAILGSVKDHPLVINLIQELKVGYAKQVQALDKQK